MAIPYSPIGGDMALVPLRALLARFVAPGFEAALRRKKHAVLALQGGRGAHPFCTSTMKTSIFESHLDHPLSVPCLLSKV